MPGNGSGSERQNQHSGPRFRNDRALKTDGFGGGSLPSQVGKIQGNRTARRGDAVPDQKVVVAIGLYVPVVTVLSGAVFERAFRERPLGRDINFLVALPRGYQFDAPWA